ncbi:MAG: RNA 2',3'-cyclic phosphodiesterase, partial [Bacteroidales bacterium]
TLKFLGDTPNKQVPEIAELLEKSLEDSKSFNFQITGFGYFGNSRFPRVLWLGTEHTKDLQNIQKKVSRALKDFGQHENNQDFKPHLTIGRVKEFNSMNELFELEANMEDEIFQIVEIKEVILYESFLKPAGPVYKAIKKVSLK